jgi:hypothetical protein
MYLGNDLQVAFPTYRNIDDISGSFNGVTKSFPLLVGGVAPVPQPLNEFQCLISVNGVVQKPDPSGASGFKLSGGNIVFSAAPTGGQTFFGVILAGADYVNVGANFPSGTQSVPSITFDSDLDTGIYNSGANQLSFATGGIERFRIDSAGQIEAVGLGSAASPTFSWTTDTNTGIYSPGADQVAISTNGTGRLFVDASGRLGLGTSTPGQALDVVGTIQATATTATGFNRVFDTSGITTGRANLRIQNSSGGVILGIEDSTGGSTLTGSAANSAYVGTNTNTPFYLAQNATIRATIDTSGRLGIGVTGPSSILDVNGPITLRSGGTVRGYVGDVDADTNIQVRSEAQTVFKIGNNEAARIDASRRLLVGTSSARNNFFNTSVSAGIQLEAAGDPGAINRRLSVVYGDINGFGPYLILGTHRSSSIGGITVVQNGDELGGVTFQGSDGTEFVEGARIQAFVDGTPGANDMPGRLVFSTTADGASSPTERMRIDQAGRVGVNVTPATNTRLDLSGTYAQNIVAVAALDIDCSTGNYFTKTISSNSTFTFGSVPASRAYSFTLELTHTSGTVTWPTSVKWPGDTTPSLTTGKTHLFIFVTDDGGSRWRGASLVDYVN